MRGFVKNTLSDLMKHPPAETAPTVTAPRPQGNRRQRLAQQSVMRGVQKQLAKQGVKMEMGTPTPQPSPSKKTEKQAVITDELKEMTEDFKKESEQLIGVDTPP